jgi:DNA-binding PadR family transcriptional regulator
LKKPWFHILLALAEGPSHGAEIQRKVNASDRDVRLYPVTLYRSLDDLTELGFIVETDPVDAAPHREKRRHFKITGAGRKALAAEAEQLESAASRARAALQGGVG